MLNRIKSPWMGIWNGVGGKIEKGEEPKESVLREIMEETGIPLSDVEYKGVVTWMVDGLITGGMHAFLAEVPKDFEYHTPISTDEGILDWKKISWILHPDNLGMANLKYFLLKMLEDSNTYNHKFVYENGNVADYSAEPMEEFVNV
ncbi:DNA mismatch repair protein MutT [Heyndrickxia shackletonii]|uniref:DNA mismatch repair protein MutT n=2 Tax=Heyndrickxia shackletonii TaxID=157838 RepID=A0A0Q3WSD5_9BACI|nr:DNA mismatch repair protein MutT [Heyndrickxia shackletonii]NEZ00828.1 NUDIX domain-containing protein [Heyndrickxia shackletonii]